MMVSEGRLPESDLLFYLSIHELQKLVNERDSALVLRAKSRKRLHNKKDKLIFSETVIGPIMTPRNVSLVLLYCSTF
jgi:pyruvate,water dikinase